MNLPDNVLVFLEQTLEVKLYQWQARINRLGLKRGNSMQKPQKRGVKFRRQLDRLLDVPLLWALGKLRRPRSMPAEIRRVVILQTAADFYCSMWR
jgi:hypothetical protein